MVAINKEFVMFVPTGRAINPITKTNWEGTGVTPDVPVASEKALEQAQILVEALMNAPAIDENTLKSYAGTYEDRTVIYDGGKLYYQRKGRQKYQMTPISQDTFMFKDLDYFRLKFVKDPNGNVTEVNGLYDDGNIDKSVKTN
jgi:hypothetical protein